MTRGDCGVLRMTSGYDKSSSSSLRLDQSCYKTLSKFLFKHNRRTLSHDESAKFNICTKILMDVNSTEHETRYFVRFPNMMQSTLFYVKGHLPYHPYSVMSNSIFFSSKKINISFESVSLDHILSLTLSLFISVFYLLNTYTIHKSHENTITSKDCSFKH